MTLIASSLRISWRGLLTWLRLSRHIRLGAGLPHCLTATSMYPAEVTYVYSDRYVALCMCCGSLRVGGLARFILDETVDEFLKVRALSNVSIATGYLVAKPY